jgi:RimJ/RimL family protein N-acetyltransferase
MAGWSDILSDTLLGPCVLDGRYVRLEPLLSSHADAILEAGKGSEWTWMSKDLSTKRSVDEWISDALQAQSRGEEYAFVVKYQNKVVGSTRYMDIQPKSKGAEIGWTWYTKLVWGTVVNPECKFLLLRHAFEDWGAIRVQLKTDNNNLHSQKAILKLGAKFEGRLRNHRFRRDGSIRDTMMYSITSEEWPIIKEGLSHRITAEET